MTAHAPDPPEAFSPPFGQADLTNCERELIHLAGSIQPHGLLLVVDETSLTVRQASANAAAWLGLDGAVPGLPLQAIAPELAHAVQAHAATLGRDPQPLLLALTPRGRGATWWEGALHRMQPGQVIVELEPLQRSDLPTVAYEQPQLLALVGQAVQRLSEAASIGLLADATVQCVRDLIGYDRVMVYRFDPEGHGKIIAEARDPRLESLLGHHYPATDIPQRARALYLSNRVRVLADVDAPASPLIGAPGGPAAHELDMSMCFLRSMSPLHLQYLRNMGVTATVVASLVREGQLWGLIAAHHDAPRNVRHSVRAACDLIAEVVSTRIAAIENYAHAQVAVMVRRLEQRLIEATSTEGDWRLALFRNPRTLLQPLDATGAALFIDGETLTSGEVPSTPELVALREWIATQPHEPLFATSSVVKANPALTTLTPVASGVLAVPLSSQRDDWLMWFRKEQLQSVTWAGDPSKPMIDNDPLNLSPRRSFAAWSEIVRGTAVPWSSAEQALARAFGTALVDIIVQVHAVRLLIAEQQIAAIRGTVQRAGEAVYIADAGGRGLYGNEAFFALTGARTADVPRLHDLARLVTEPERLRQALQALRGGHPAWRGELTLARDGGAAWPVLVRAEAIGGRDGGLLGYVVAVFDQRDSQRAAEARRHLEESVLRAHSPQRGGTAGAHPGDEVIGAILTNASLAAMDISDGSIGTPVATLLEELEVSTRRATVLFEQLRRLSAAPGDGHPA